MQLGQALEHGFAAQQRRIAQRIGQHSGVSAASAGTGERRIAQVPGLGLHPAAIAVVGPEESEIGGMPGEPALERGTGPAGRTFRRHEARGAAGASAARSITSKSVPQ